MSLRGPAGVLNDLIVDPAYRGRGVGRLLLDEIVSRLKARDLPRVVLSTAANGSGQGMRECWRQRLQAMRGDLGYAEASALERLLIQQVTLCWLNLNLAEYRFTNVTKQSISLAVGIYWEKRLTAAQRRFTRACETLARVRKLSRNTPALQFKLATSGGQQVNVAK